MTSDIWHKTIMEIMGTTYSMKSLELYGACVYSVFIKTGTSLGCTLRSVSPQLALEHGFVVKNWGQKKTIICDIQIVI